MSNGDAAYQHGDTHKTLGVREAHFRVRYADLVKSTQNGQVNFSASNLRYYIARQQHVQAIPSNVVCTYFLIRTSALGLMLYKATYLYHLWLQSAQKLDPVAKMSFTVSIARLCQTMTWIYSDSASLEKSFNPIPYTEFHTLHTSHSPSSSNSCP